MNAPDIRFPNLGIDLNHVGTGFTVFGFRIAFYGMIIAAGMMIGFFLVEWQAKRTKQSTDLYLDFALYAIIISVIGARAYYVLFSWNEFKDNPLQIFNLRGGGLAIYGGVIAGVITALVYCKLKKVSFRLVADTCCVGLLAGQIIGRWGNFFNREAFGGYTDSLFAMQIKRADVSSSMITPDLLKHLVYVDGIEYLQVHPTFLYESFWNLCILLLILLYAKHKKFDGELALFYLIGYGTGRAWIESLRTDQLLFWGTKVPVSEILSIILAVVCFCVWAFVRVWIRKKGSRSNDLKIN